jgi:hypothetical protein
MKTITFKQQFTFNEEAVMGFAIFLGWRDMIETQSEYKDGEMARTIMIENPESFTDFVDRKAREHSLEFTKSWAEKLKQDYINKTVAENIEPQLHEQIVKPVEDALISEVIIN